MTEAPIVLGDIKQKKVSEPTLISRLESGNDILKQLLREHHSDLMSAKILLLCTNKEIKTGGRPRPGKVSKASPLVDYLSSDERGGGGADIIVMVSLPVWNDADGMKRAAIIDHLLTCVEVKEDETTGELKYSIVSPGLAEFAEIAERYGAYTPELQDMRNVLAKTPETVTPHTR